MSCNPTISSYEAHSVLSARFRNDMLHIALATIADVDVLVSWNFRHIVRLDKIRLFNAVNIEQGYKPVSIYSPRGHQLWARRLNFMRSLSSARFETSRPRR